MSLPKTEINAVLGDWKLVKNHCRVTDNKDFTDKEPSKEWCKKMIITEHSPIRTLLFDVTWRDMPYWVHAELARHKWEKFISTQRDDRVNSDTPRGQKPQDTPVRFDGFANPQNLIDMARKRLCFCATPEARGYIVSLKFELKDSGYEEVADAMVPHCVYRCGCPEAFNKACNFFNTFARIANERHVDLFDIQSRYDLYNELLEKAERK